MKMNLDNSSTVQHMHSREEAALVRGGSSAFGDAGHHAGVPVRSSDGSFGM